MVFCIFGGGGGGGGGGGLITCIISIHHKKNFFRQKLKYFVFLKIIFEVCVNINHFGLNEKKNDARSFIDCILAFTTVNLVPWNSWHALRGD